MSNKQVIMTLLNGGRPQEARSLCETWCATHPRDAEAWLLLAGIHAQTGDLHQVVTCCRQVIDLQPDNLGAHYNLGVALQALNRLEEAAESYRQLLRRQPDHAQAQANLGLVLRELGRLEPAAAHCRQALAIAPSLAEAHNTLGLILKDQGLIEEAVFSFQQALRNNPSLAVTHYNLGLCHSRQARHDQAIACYRRALQLNPDFAEVYVDLGNSLKAIGNVDEAIASYQRAIALKPDCSQGYLALGGVLLTEMRYPEAEACFAEMTRNLPDRADGNCQLGIACNKQFRFDEAERWFLTALQRDPGHLDSVLGLAIALRYQGRYDEALIRLDEILARTPEHSDATLEKVRLLQLAGRLDAARAILQPFVDRKPVEPRAAILYASLAENAANHEGAAELLETVLAEDGLAAAQKINLHFALGTAYDAASKYDRAFAHFHQGNSLVPASFDPMRNRAMFDALIDVYSADKQAKRPRASNRSQLPVFIVGMPRSGTSLVEQILASHALVYGAGELTDLNKIAASLPETLGTTVPYPRCVDMLDRDTLDRIATRHLERLAAFSRNVARVTDKMPHNFLNMGLIEMLFPNARIIHCMRDPLDTCLSCYFQYFGGAHPYAYDLGHLGAYYNQYHRLMEHWKKTLNIPILDIRYEELVADQERVSRALVEFCGLDWDDRCLDFHIARRITKTASYGQVRQPIYRKSVARWKNYETHLTPLQVALENGVS